MHWQGGERRRRGGGQHQAHGRTAGRVGSSRWVSRLACAAGHGGGGHRKAAKALHWSSTSTRKSSTHRGLTPGPTAPSQCCVAGAANAAPTACAALVRRSQLSSSLFLHRAAALLTAAALPHRGLEHYVLHTAMVRLLLLKTSY